LAHTETSRFCKAPQKMSISAPHIPLDVSRVGKRRKGAIHDDLVGSIFAQNPARSGQCSSSHRRRIYLRAGGARRPFAPIATASAERAGSPRRADLRRTLRAREWSMIAAAWRGATAPGPSFTVVVGLVDHSPRIGGSPLCRRRRLPERRLEPQERALFRGHTTDIAERRICGHSLHGREHHAPKRAAKVNPLLSAVLQLVLE